MIFQEKELRDEVESLKLQLRGMVLVNVELNERVRAFVRLQECARNYNPGQHGDHVCCPCVDHIHELYHK